MALSAHTKQDLRMFQNANFDGHQRMVNFFDPESGLRCIIAIHSTALGPAAGGCRLWAYDDPQLAVSDALRLSRGMSYKNALAGLPMGGGKAVILGPVPPLQRKAVFGAFGRAVESLNGLYITAEDVGVTEEDMAIVANHTMFASGIAKRGGVGGNPSPFTAQGVRLGIEAAARAAFGRTDIEGMRISVQGLGGVGSNLCRELHAKGAKLIVADVAEDRVQQACDLYGAARVSIDEILLVEADILSPCALGGVITKDIANKLRVHVVAGGANNQLENDTAGHILFERGITYAPDYVINAGGIIMVTAEYLGTTSLEKVERAIGAIGERTSEILERSRVGATATHVVADQMAKTLLHNAAA
jgi:leucine dehydrogenase